MIFHIIGSNRWATATAAGLYEADSLASDGFIHCSTEQQVARVANAGFRGRKDLVVLHIDESRLEAEVRYENLEGGDELFPHIYGSVLTAAVSRVTTFAPGPDGLFEFP